MKKLLILIISVFLLTGCYDNIELNNLAIVTGVGIDYIDDNFFVTYEILNDTNTEEVISMKSFTTSGKGKNINEAFTNVNYKVSKKPYFAHLKVVVISKEIVDNHLKDIVDYLLRDTNIRDEFFLFATTNSTPLEILSHNSNYYPVVSDLIINLKDNEKYNNNLAIDENYQQLLAKIISKNCDGIIGTLSLNDDEITIDKFLILKGYKYQATLTKEESTIYNLLTTNVLAKDFNKMYDKGNVAISITYSASDIDVLDDEIKINVELKGKIIENNPNFDLKNEKVYEKLNKDFGKLIEDEITDFIKVLQKNQSDVLGLQEIYYKKNRKDNHNLWTHAKINVSVNLKINTKGFIFEVMP